MKKRIKIISLSALFLCVILSAGILMPEAAVRIADRQSENEQEEFETGTVSSFSLTDRLRLADAYDQEMYVDVADGTILERGDAEQIADKRSWPFTELWILYPAKNARQPLLWLFRRKIWMLRCSGDVHCQTNTGSE